MQAIEGKDNFVISIYLWLALSVKKQCLYSIYYNDFAVFK
jgi:hypothetical protein